MYTGLGGGVKFSHSSLSQCVQCGKLIWETRQGEARIPVRGLDPYPPHNGEQT